MCDIDFLRRQVHVEQQVRLLGTRLDLASPKRRKTRTVPLPDTVAVELAEHLRRNPAEGTELVFRTREGNPITRNTFNHHTWKPALVAAGVELMRANGMHALRHVYAGPHRRRRVGARRGRLPRSRRSRLHPPVCAHLFPSSDDRARKAVDRCLSGPTIRGEADG